MKNKILCILTIFLLTACGSDGWFGEKDNEPKLEGKRLTVLKLENRLIPDNDIEKIKIELPAPQDLNLWANSNGSEYNNPGNIKLDKIGESYKESRVIPLSRKPYYLTATPVIAGDTIFVMNGIGSVFAYNKENLNKPIWQKHLSPIDEKEETVGGGMVYDHGKLFASSGHKDIVALNSENGKEIWRHSLNNIVRAAPIIQDDKLFVVTIDNKLYALSLFDGNIIWAHDGAAENIGIFGSASIASSKDIVIAPHSSGQLHALDIRDGQEIWSVNLSYNRTSMSGFSFPDIDVTPVIKDNVVYVAGNMGLLYAINLHDGDLLWQREIKGIRSIWVAGNSMYVVNNGNELICLYNKDGRLKWIKQLDKYKNEKKHKGNINVTGPVLAGNKLVLVNSDGKMLFASPYDGNIIEEKKVPAKINLLPVIVGGHIYLLSNSGNLTIY
jgi:outer membrane protein assembly factor BamB